MSKTYTILIVEDEPLIMMDLEFAAEDRECEVLTAVSVAKAMAEIELASHIDVAILDVTLGKGETCLPIARMLEQRDVPYILHTGDLDRQEEKVRQLDAPLIAKPAASEKVIAAAIVAAEGEDLAQIRLAAE